MDIYRENILDEAKYPSHYGKLAGALIVVQEFNPACGDSVTLYLKLDRSKQKIIDLGWEGQGCVISRASMSVLAQKVVGMSISKLAKITKKDLATTLGLDSISPAREKCLTLGLMALKQALKQVLKQTAKQT
jgi:nitrogen fixation NifU-like protein